MAKDMSVWVTGGYFDESGECFVYEIDVKKNIKKEIIKFVPPDNFLVPRKGFTGAVWTQFPGKSDLLVCGFSCIFRFSPPNWKFSGVIHQPCMNDLHHVTIYENTIYIVNTGLETVDLFNQNGYFIGSYSFQPSWINKERQCGNTPSRKDWNLLLQAGWENNSFVFTNTPPTNKYYQSNHSNFHQKPIRDFIHLNHVAILSDQILVTSLSNRCVYNVHNFAKVIDNIPSPPHDGFIYNDSFWITCVDGQIIGYKIKNQKISDEINYSFNLFDHIKHHGWCRGIFIKNDYLFVGITEIKRQPQYDWKVASWETTKTGIICWDLSKNKFAYFVDLSEERHSKIFSIIECS